MALTDVGSYVLCKEPGSDGPPWPGVVYAGDPIPRHVRETQPKGLVTLVLLFTEPYTFYWAKTTWLSPLVPLKDGDHSVNSEALQQAYGTAAFMMEAQMGMEQYQELVEDQFGNDGFAHPAPHGVVEDEQEVDEEIWGNESEVDEELSEALRISLSESQSSTSRSLPSPSDSPPERFRRRSSTSTLADEDSPPKVYVRPRAQRDSRASPKRSKASRLYKGGIRDSPILVDDDFPTRKRRRISTPDVERSNGLSVREGKQPQKRFSMGSNADQLLDLNNLGQSSAAPASDVVEEEDLSQSKVFVQVHVGPQGEVLNLPKEDVWNRLYFRNAGSGTNRFDYTEGGAYVLRHPALASITTDDFQYVAEYLAVEEFGIREPFTPEEVKIACAQCISAWESAEKLGMDDFLDHIAKKVGFLAWDHAEVLAMAIIVYRGRGAVLRAHERMREWASGYLAQHFWALTKDPEIGSIFRKRLRRLPELQRDVFVKRAQNLVAGTEQDEDKESDEDDLDSDEDL